VSDLKPHAAAPSHRQRNGPAAPLQFVNGNIERLTAPGLGIDVDESAVRAADAHGHRWRTPLWRHSDGSLAEW